MKYKIIKNDKWQEIKINNLFQRIPDGWITNKLRNISYLTDGTHSSPKTVKNKNSEFYYLTVRDLNWTGKIDFENAERVTSDDYEKLSKSNCAPIKGDILLSKDGTVGKVAIFNSNLKTVVLSSLAIIRFSGLNNNYGYFVFKSNYAKKQLFDHKNGNAIKRIVLKQLNDFEIFYPNEKIQTKIVKILKKQESIISNIEKLISKTEKMFEYFCNREFELGNIEKNNYQIKNIIIRNPKSTIKAGDIKESKGNIPAFNSSAKLQYFYDDYLVDGENIFLPDGGQSSIHYLEGKAAYSSHVLSFKLKKEVMTKYFYFYFKNNKNLLDSMFQGAALKNLNKKYFFDYQISIPNMEKQKETVELLEKQERLIENQKKLLEKEKQKFEWLSEKLLSGEYSVVEEQE